MVLFLVVVGIFVLSVAIGSAIGSGLARLVLLWMERGSRLAGARPRHHHALTTRAS